MPTLKRGSILLPLVAGTQFQIFCRMIALQSTMIARFGKKWYSNAMRGDPIHGSHCKKYATTSSA